MGFARAIAVKSGGRESHFIAAKTAKPPATRANV
jgi:hypothetical protein